MISGQNSAAPPPANIGVAGWLRGEKARVCLLFYVGVPAVTALFFGLNHAGMARFLQPTLAVPYWLGLTLPLWALLDLCTRALAHVLARYSLKPWLLLCAGALVAMAFFSPYVVLYVRFFTPNLPVGTVYSVTPPFPEAFLDLRRFVMYSGVPIYWTLVASVFATVFQYPAYLVKRVSEAAGPELAASTETQLLNDYGLPVRSGFRSLIPFHLGDNLISLTSEDHYLRVVTDRGNALVRYRFSEALTEVRGIPGMQIHRSHWVSVGAIARVSSAGKGYQVHLHNGDTIPVSRTNIGLLRTSGLL